MIAFQKDNVSNCKPLITYSSNPQCQHPYHLSPRHHKRETSERSVPHTSLSVRLCSLLHIIRGTLPSDDEENHFHLLGGSGQYTLQTPIPPSYHQASRDHSPPSATSWRCHARTRMPRPQPHSAERPKTTPPTSHIPPHTNNNHFATAFSLTSIFKLRLAAQPSTMRPRAQSAPRRSVAGSHFGGDQNRLSRHHQPNFHLLPSNNSQIFAHLLLAIKHFAITNSRQQVGRTSRVLRRAPLSQVSALAFQHLTRTLWSTTRLRASQFPSMPSTDHSLTSHRWRQPAAMCRKTIAPWGLLRQSARRPWYPRVPTVL
jgi:hypothetical protein